MNSVAAKNDYFLVSLIGIGFGILLVPVLENINPGFWSLTFLNVGLLVMSFFIFANAALWVGGITGHNWPAMWQFTKFAAIGSFNAILDLSILNLLSLIFQVYQGPMIIIFNVISFSIAVTNSYIFNKFWTFRNVDPINRGEYIKFVLASFGGLVINTAIVYGLTTFIQLTGISLPLWENIAKLIAVAPSLLWNFMAYRLVVFK
ncbi:MAG: GtrA family protein [bacterium]|nr:GtrA family protein [bacterium]